MSTEPKRINDINALKEPARTACKIFMQEAQRRDIPIFIVETIRTAERQNWLFRNRPESTQLDGYKNISNHQPGLAWDIACKGPVLYDKNIMDRAGAIGIQMGITWGGSWGWDSPHFEVKSNWKPKALKPATSKTKLKLNGVVKQVDTILKDGNNFIKIRDLQDNKTSVSYSSGKVFVNGIHYAGDMINLDGNNYVKLRDLPGNIISVGYDSANKMPIVNTK